MQLKHCVNKIELIQQVSIRKLRRPWIIKKKNPCTKVYQLQSLHSERRRSGETSQNWCSWSRFDLALIGDSSQKYKRLWSRRDIRFSANKMMSVSNVQSTPYKSRTTLFPFLALLRLFRKMYWKIGQNLKK